MKRFTAALALVLAGLLLLGATSPELRVQAHAGKLTVDADSVPLDGVLWAISAQTGIRLHLPGGDRLPGFWWRIALPTYRWSRGSPASSGSISGN